MRDARVAAHAMEIYGDSGREGALVEAAAALFPRSASAMTTLAAKRYFAGRLEGSREAVAKALALAPGDGVARYVAVWARTHGHPEKFDPLIAAVGSRDLERESSGLRSPWVRPYTIAHGRGCVAVDVGDARTAIEQAQLAVATATRRSDAAEAWNVFARALARFDPKRAAAAARVHDALAMPRRADGRALLRADASGRSDAALDAAIAREPWEPVYRILKGRVATNLSDEVAGAFVDDLDALHGILALARYASPGASQRMLQMDPETFELAAPSGPAEEAAGHATRAALSLWVAEGDSEVAQAIAGRRRAVQALVHLREAENVQPLALALAPIRAVALDRLGARRAADRQASWISRLLGEPGGAALALLRREIASPESDLSGLVAAAERAWGAARRPTDFEELSGIRDAIERHDSQWRAGRLGLHALLLPRDLGERLRCGRVVAGDLEPLVEPEDGRIELELEGQAIDAELLLEPSTKAILLDCAGDELEIPLERAARVRIPVSRRVDGPHRIALRSREGAVRLACVFVRRGGTLLEVNRDIAAAVAVFQRIQGHVRASESLEDPLPELAATWVLEVTERLGDEAFLDFAFEKLQKRSPRPEERSSWLERLRAGLPRGTVARVLSRS